MPHDLPPWPAVYQQMRRWMEAGVFEILVADVQSLLRECGGRTDQPSAVCLDSRTLQSTPESGARAGYDGAKRRKGSKVHIAVDTLGHLMALKVTSADHGNRAQVAALAGVQQVTGHTVDLAYVDQGYTGPNAAEAALQHGIQLEVVKHPMAKRGFVPLPRRLRMQYVHTHMQRTCVKDITASSLRVLLSSKSRLLCKRSLSSIAHRFSEVLNQAAT
jgi:transposase